MKFNIVCKRPSKGAIELRNALRAKGHKAIKSPGKAADRFNIQWGVSSNKLLDFRAMQAAGNVSTVEFTDDINIAAEWLNEGHLVYERHSLNGHSGDGIKLVGQSFGGTLSEAPLYTRGITKKRREYRIHVVGTQCFVQQKRRRNTPEGAPKAPGQVRNLDNGWIFAVNNVETPRPLTMLNACKAVEALGLTFGAVDIIELIEQPESFVLEVNSAPGVQGSSADFYANAFIKLAGGEEQ